MQPKKQTNKATYPCTSLYLKINEFKVEINYIGWNGNNEYND